MNLKLIKFYGSNCHGCSVMSPIYGRLEKEYSDNKDIEFDSVNVEEDEDDLCGKYKIRNIPTILFIKNGSVVERIAGTRSYEQVKNSIEKWK